MYNLCLNICPLVIGVSSSSSSSSSSAIQLFVSFGLLNYFFPLFPLLRPLFPVGHPHLPQVIPHIVFPSYSWPSLRSCCVRFPFVYGLGHSFIGHSFYMPQPAQSFVYRKLRRPDFVTTAQDGGRLSALRTGRFLPPGNTPGTHFC